jgi:hypothetical protein
MDTPSTFGQLVAGLIDFIGLLVPLVFALTVVYLSWGIIKAWVINGGDQGAIDDGKKIAVAGVVALVVMLGVWGIVAMLRASLGFT